MRTMLAQLFAGRNGIDQLNRAAAVVGVLSWGASLLIPVTGIKNLLECVFLLAAGIFIYRSLSRNVERRSAENQKFLMKTGALQNTRESWQTRMEQRRQYKVFKCPSCGLKLRVPRGKGKIRVNCRQCGATFEENS